MGYTYLQYSPEIKSKMDMDHRYGNYSSMEYSTVCMYVCMDGWMYGWMNWIERI